jgi:hypothetical protein
MSRLVRAVAIFLTLTLSFGAVTAIAQTMTLAAYDADGANTGTARLNRNVLVKASIPGNSSPNVTWSVSGAGTITSGGSYTAPAAMPSNGTVVITAKLVSNTSVTASYTAKLIYNPPTIHWTTPETLVSGQTSSVQVGGLDFTAATTITVNGAAVPTAFQSSTASVAQVTIPAGSTSAVSIVASNPAPGGGSSAAIVVPVNPLSVAVSSYSNAGANPSFLYLDQEAQFAAVVSGGNPAIGWPVTWSLSGAGSISATGLYKSPAAMPSNTNVVVTATLNANTSIKATYTLSLLDPKPIVNQSLPVEISSVGTNKVTFYGENFTPATTIQWNGHSAATTYLSPNAVSAQVYLPAGASNQLYITATNPAPNGGVSAQFLLPIGDTNSVKATIGTTAGQAIPGDFLGFSHEWGMQSLMGNTKTGVNNIYRQLVQNLSNPGTPFFIRIGGGSTDISAAPTTGYIQGFSDLATAMPVKFTLGVNLANDNLQLAETQASYFTQNMPSGSITAIELGNEPDNYARAGVRPSTYDFAGYLTDFATWDNGITPLIPSGVKMIGPSLTTVWHLQQDLPALETAEANNVSIVSAHYYGGYSDTLPADYLLQDSTVTHNIASFQSLASIAHKNGQLFRIDETNSIDGGGVLGMSNTFSAALWAVDVMFAEASVGVDGVNWHGNSGCPYCAFTFNTQNEAGTNTFSLQYVNPLYYGLLFFHYASANSAKMLPVTFTTASKANVKVWATVDAAGTIHVAILNKDEAFTGNVSVTVPGYGTAAAKRLAAPNFLSTAGVTLGGQTFDNSFDGNLIGSAMNESFAPTNSVYTVPVQPMSAVLLTLTK